MNLIQRDRQVIWHPYTHQKNMQDPIPIVRGQGLYLEDENGNRYIDAISSWWVTIHGHAHPYIAAKIYEQAQTLEQVIFAGFTHLPAVSLAERLLPLLPGSFSRIFYSDNGSTAVEVAIKMALQYWWNQHKDKHPPRPRTKILAFNNSYHGDTFGAMSISDRGVFTLAFHDKLFEVVFIDTPANDDASLPAIDWSEIACFIYEPLIQGAGGMKMYPAKAMNRLLAKCREHDIICIADEVMTGFGRTGNLFASEECSEKPDIICLSKGLTGGTMAMGITACTHKIYDAFVSDDKQRTFYHGHSFTANPLACAAALASLDLLQHPTVAEQRQMIRAMHLEFLTQLNADFTSLISEPRVQGTILAFELATGENSYLNNVGPLLTRYALTNAVFLRPLGNTVYIMPPYCITAEELRKVYGVIIGFLKEMRALK